eukprot:29141-Pelagococcus_subviridis.AAC.2
MITTDDSFRARWSSIIPICPARRNSFVLPNWYDASFTSKCWRIAWQKGTMSVAASPNGALAALGRRNPNRSAKSRCAYRVG